LDALSILLLPAEQSSPAARQGQGRGGRVLDHDDCPQKAHYCPECCRHWYSAGRLT